MFSRTLLAALLLTLVVAAPGFADQRLPHLVQQGECTQLIVDGKPFLLIAGELHNSSASTLEYVTPLLRRVRQMHLNSVLAPISWEQFEPHEGEYDYTLIDGLVKECAANDLKLVVLWFGTWKNGQSTYAPLWVKRDMDRFERVRDQDGRRLETLSPFCDATREADCTAFAALMRRIREVDDSCTVLMVQPENEAGILLDMDYGRSALTAFSGSVPQKLMDWLCEHREELSAPIRAAWSAQGRPTSGTWSAVFGDTPDAREFLLAWRTASFIGAVAEAGRREHLLPMFANAWLVQQQYDPPGTYPNGGPVARVMDIYKAAAPELFTLAPDIYLPNFKEICARYTCKDNPLLIPESTVDAGRAFFAFAEHDAICYSPFAVEERAYGDKAFQQAYGVLGELHDTIAAHQGTGSMRGLLREGDEQMESVTLGRYRVDVYYESQSEPCYGLVIQTGDHEFLVAGVNLRVEFRAEDESVVGYIGQVREVRRDGRQWRTVRVLNGDETFHHGSLRVLGRDSRVSYSESNRVGLGPQPTAEDDLESRPGSTRVVKTPGIYVVTTYIRSR